MIYHPILFIKTLNKGTKKVELMDLSPEFKRNRYINWINLLQTLKVFIRVLIQDPVFVGSKILVGF